MSDAKKEAGAEDAPKAKGGKKKSAAQKAEDAVRGSLKPKKK